MEKEVFMNLKNKLINALVECELLQRKIYFLSQAYLLEFHDYLEQNLYLTQENNILINSIKLKVDGKTLEEIKDYQKDAEAEFTKQLNDFNRKYQKALDLKKRCKNYSENDLIQLDENFKQYCILYHPVLKVNSSMQEQLIYQSLASLYREGNITGYRNLINEFSNVLSPVQIEDKDLEIASVHYQKSLDDILRAVQQQKEQMPLIKEDIFNDDAKMTNEYADIRETNYEGKQMNQNLQKDYQEQFGSTYELKK